jgi:hypothetical protein
MERLFNRKWERIIIEIDSAKRKARAIAFIPYSRDR